MYQQHHSTAPINSFSASTSPNHHQPQVPQPLLSNPHHHHHPYSTQPPPPPPMTAANFASMYAAYFPYYMNQFPYASSQHPPQPPSFGHPPAFATAADPHEQKQQPALFSQTSLNVNSGGANNNFRPAASNNNLPSASTSNRSNSSNGSRDGSVPPPQSSLSGNGHMDGSYASSDLTAQHQQQTMNAMAHEHYMNFAQQQQKYTQYMAASSNHHQKSASQYKPPVLFPFPPLLGFF